jgi:hypothetical protein
MADNYIQNVPVPYMDIQTLWSDRREPHANPLSSGSSGRRMVARTSPSTLGKSIEGLYHPGVFAERASAPITKKRLYGDQKK